MIFIATLLAAAAIGACGFLGAPQVPTDQAASFTAGALTLAGALVICVLFSLKSRWHGIGGAAVVALAGGARNTGAWVAIAHSAITSSPVPPGDAYRAIIAATCFGLFAFVAGILLAERRRRQAPK